ncbi:hypothetical protein JYK14_24550 [Siccirubricoccus sp. KC 17139]|uniref:Uncharacterized protein n=1 Tax=Siccirubricoccus soli TaxID=2899147 RepID=A0ABT1DBI6_9PROT|nr:hypothetical protein [Siccirubricoccus soli]MCO6419306.1 hypothetical protein [Siccirubricoccus soli]MCP2685441.1 hypothetical protein [Siccirubricoccus soli]
MSETTFLVVGDHAQSGKLVAIDHLHTDAAGQPNGMAAPLYLKRTKRWGACASVSLNDLGNIRVLETEHEVPMYAKGRFRTAEAAEAFAARMQSLVPSRAAPAPAASEDASSGEDALAGELLRRGAQVLEQGWIPAGDVPNAEDGLRICRQDWEAAASAVERASLHSFMAELALWLADGIQASGADRNGRRLDAACAMSHLRTRVVFVTEEGLREFEESLVAEEARAKAELLAAGERLRAAGNGRDPQAEAVVLEVLTAALRAGAPPYWREVRSARYVAAGRDWTVEADLEFWDGEEATVRVWDQRPRYESHGVHWTKGNERGLVFRDGTWVRGSLGFAKPAAATPGKRKPKAAPASPKAAGMAPLAAITVALSRIGVPAH